MKYTPVMQLTFLSFCSGETNPIYNVNLAPFIQRLSAYYCLHNVSSDCPGNFTLTEKGWLNISQSDTKAFCQGGCLEHTQEVLKCVWYVHEEYTFENGATIKNLNDTIDIGCNHVPHCGLTLVLDRSGWVMSDGSSCGSNGS
ncbi:hypothetical protein R6Q59_025967 [Mikania micrantha]